MTVLGHVCMAVDYCPEMLGSNFLHQIGEMMGLIDLALVALSPVSS